MSLRKKLAIVLLFTVIAMSTILLYINISNDVSSKNEMLVYELGEIKNPGKIGAAVTYDINAPTVILQSPSGFIYTAKTADEYEDSGNTIKIFANSNETGVWSIQFNRKDNKNISYELLTDEQGLISIKETSIIKLENIYYIGYSLIADDSIQYTPSLKLKTNGNSYDLIIPEESKLLKTKTEDDMFYIPLILPKEDFKNEQTGVIELTITTEYQSTSYSTNVRFIENTISVADIIQNS